MTLLFQELIIKTTTLANASVALQEFTAIVTFSDKNSTDNQQDNPGRLKSDGRCFDFFRLFYSLLMFTISFCLLPASICLVHVSQLLLPCCPTYCVVLPFLKKKSSPLSSFLSSQKDFTWPSFCFRLHYLKTNHQKGQHEKFNISITHPFPPPR